jgi:hypothetical protein
VLYTQSLEPRNSIEAMDYAREHHESHIGCSASELQTPALIVSKSVLEDNIRQLHGDVENLGIDFRPHTKTLKVVPNPSPSEFNRLL